MISSKKCKLGGERNRPRARGGGCLILNGHKSGIWDNFSPTDRAKFTFYHGLSTKCTLNGPPEKHGLATIPDVPKQPKKGKYACKHKLVGARGQVTRTLLFSSDTSLIFICGSLDPGSVDGMYSLLRPVGVSDALDKLLLSDTSAPSRYLTRKPSSYHEITR